MPLPLPPEIRLGPGHVLEDRSLLDLVEADDRARVSTGFITARRTGQGVAQARLVADGQAIKVWYMDLEPDLPVCVRLCVDDRSRENVLGAPDRIAKRARLGIITKDEAARIVSMDEGAVDLLGWSPADVIGSSTLDFIHPDDRERALDNWWSMHLGAGSQVVRIRYRRADGSWLWLDTSNSYDRTERGTGSVICQVIDASREMAAADALRRNEELLRRLTETLPVGLCFLTTDRVVSYLNPRLTELLATNDVPDLDALEKLLTCEQSGSLAAAASEALDQGRDCEVAVTLVPADRAPIRCRVTLSTVLDEGEVTGALVCFVDVTELKRQATTDPLTGLLNRQAILGMLTEALTGEIGAAGVLYLDLDLFKPVNDEYGHRVGDQVLTEVAERLRTAVRDRDVVGRLGGDEFVVVCPGLKTPQALERVAARVTDCMREPFVHDHGAVTIGFSVGMTLADGPDDLPQRIIARADAAMYAAKRNADGPAWAQAIPSTSAASSSST
ncbi:MAG TPA: diguanylate cyclase [Mycobacteriales bacterium]